MENNHIKYPIKYGEKEKLEEYMKIHFWLNMKFGLNGSVTAHFQDGKIMKTEKKEIHK